MTKVLLEKRIGYMAYIRLLRLHSRGEEVLDLRVWRYYSNSRKRELSPTKTGIRFPKWLASELVTVLGEILVEERERGEGDTSEYS